MAPPCNFSMMTHLGASLNHKCLKTSFKNPADPENKVSVLFDACHMLKLVRNTLGAVGVLIDGDGGKIEWRYITELQKLQEKEGLHLGNKLRASHVKFHSQKMKVKLAAQTLSSSVAQAIQFCDETLKLPQFRGSAATVRFITMINNLFDVLNSRNPLGKGFKAPLKRSNRDTWEPLMEDAFKYILNLKTLEGVSILETNKKTGFIGFLICIRSVWEIFEEYVNKDNAPLLYLLTYKVAFKIFT